MYRDRDRDKLLAHVLDTHVTFLFVQSLRHNVVFNGTSLGLLGNTLLSRDPAERNFTALVVDLGLTLVDDLRPVPAIQKYDTFQPISVGPSMEPLKPPTLKGFDRIYLRHPPRQTKSTLSVL